MTTLSARIDQLRDRIDERNLRERILLLAAVVVVLFLLWDVAVQSPLSDRQQAAAERIEQLERQQEDLRTTEASLRDELEAVAEDADEDRAAGLRTEIERVDEQLAERTARVVSPSQMVAVLRDMVQADADLTLEALENLAVDEIIAEERDDGIPRVYRHRVEVVASGDFFAVLGYLQRLEALDWQFQWDDLHIETTQYPQARVTIMLSTLSLDEGWIGV